MKVKRGHKEPSDASAPFLQNQRQPALPLDILLSTPIQTNNPYLYRLFSKSLQLCSPIYDRSQYS